MKPALRFRLQPPSEKQARSILEAQARINLWWGSIRSSKTVASLLRWLHFIANAPTNGELIMVGKTERTLERNILNPLKDLSRHVITKSGEGIILGRRVYFYGANDERAEAKIRGLTCAGAYGDEITLWPETFFKQTLGRMSVKGAKFFGTTNTDSPNHYLKRDFIDRASSLDLAHWHFQLADNTSLDPDYVANISKEYTGLWYKRFIKGLWVLAEGAIYDLFDEDLHVIDNFSFNSDFDFFVAGVDYGTKNPASFGIYRISPLGGPSIVKVAEYYYDSQAVGRQKTDDQYYKDFIDFTKDYDIRTVFVDPSAASFRLLLQQRYYCPDIDNSVVDGIRTQSSMLHVGEYKIMRDCKQTINDYYSYVWDTKAQLRGEDKPIKQNDHTKDEERYVLHNIKIPNPRAQFDVIQQRIQPDF